MRVESPSPGPESLDGLPPKAIVARLDEYIIGQRDAKRAVAVAIRNRWRRRALSPEMRREVLPKNILMIGPTGVGKTEIARRIAALIEAPFIKVEASKYTEVGYHGRDVESMIRDLAKVAVGQVRERAMATVQAAARAAAEERVLDLLLPPVEYHAEEAEREKAEERRARTRAKFLEKLRAGEMDDRQVEVQAADAPPMAGVLGVLGGEEMGLELQDMMEKMMPRRTKTRRVSISEAVRLLTQEEAEKLIDEEAIQREGIEHAEQNGIVFIDEIDKVIGGDRGHGPEVSREGVQRDLLPIVEGSSVATKFGNLKTDHILFVAAGAFHGHKPNDLIPELQGRFPIRVELQSLTREDFERILTHPKNALTKQYQLLLEVEGVRVVYEDAALGLLAALTARVNKTTQDIGARRLHTVMERLFEELSFDAAEMRGQEVRITPALVEERLRSIAEDEDLSRFVL